MLPDMTKLDNGLTVVTDRIDHVETVALGVWVDVGARHETKDVNGVSHMLEHMAFKGTARRTARDIAEEIEAVGGHLNAYTSRENTAYYAKVLKEDVGLGLDIIADILQNATLDPDELERERQVILQEIAQTNDTPDDIVFDYFQKTAFPDQPIGRPVLGHPQVISQMTRETIAGFMGALYAPERMVVSAAGKIDHDRFVAMVQKAFVRFPDPAPIETVPIRYTGGDLYVARDLEQVHVVMGLPSIAYGAEKFYELAVFNTLFGGGMSSRLFQEIREKRGLVYTVYSFNSHYADGGVFGIYAGTGPSQVPELIPAICDELKRAAEDITDKEVMRARNQLKASVLMGLESCSHRCETAARQLQIFNRLIPCREIIERIEEVSRTGVLEAAMDLLHDPIPTITGHGPQLDFPDRNTVAGLLR